MPTFLASLTARQRTILVGVATAFVLLAGLAAAIFTGDGASTGTAETTPPATTVPPTTAPPDTTPRWPLTGRALDDPARAARPALVVKIDNADNGNAQSRPQAGINAADVVYEEEVEGSVTRFAAIFHSVDGGPVVPVRSGRTTDIALTANLARPLLAWSGGNGGVVAAIQGANLVDVGFDANPGAYFRAGDRPAPHDLQSHTNDLWALAPPDAAPPPPLFTYRPDGTPLPAGAEPLGSFNVNFGDGPGSAPVDWTWNGAGWARDQKGRPHLDADGTHVAPENVVVLFVPYGPSPADARSPEAHTVGEGEAWVFTAGHLVRGRWSRSAPEAPWTLTTPDGEPIGLTPGRTWVPLARNPGHVALR